MSLLETFSLKSRVFRLHATRNATRKKAPGFPRAFSHSFMNFTFELLEFLLVIPPTSGTVIPVLLLASAALETVRTVGRDSFMTFEEVTVLASGKSQLVALGADRLMGDSFLGFLEDPLEDPLDELPLEELPLLPELPPELLPDPVSLAPSTLPSVM